MLYTADWGRNAIYYHPLKGEKDAWFDIGQETFCEIERPTNIKADAAGNIFIASWKGGEYTYKGENVGYIALVRAPEAQRKAGPPPALPPVSPSDSVRLVDPKTVQAVSELLDSPSATTRLRAQRFAPRHKINPSRPGETRRTLPRTAPAIASWFTSWLIDGPGLSHSWSRRLRPPSSRR